MPKNRVKKIRIRYGITRAELMRASRLAYKTLQRLEDGKANPRDETKSRVMLGLNKLLNKLGYSSLHQSDVFPNG